MPSVLDIDCDHYSDYGWDEPIEPPMGISPWLRGFETHDLRDSIRGRWTVSGAALIGVLEGAATTIDVRSVELERFRRLVTRWRDETSHISSYTDRVLHSAYQEIIGMGQVAVPFLLQELKERGGHWFWALRAITGQNPVSPEDAGKIRKMTECWLEWGKQRRFLE